jgi:stalled ribosome rescue protein Dom34
MKLVGKHVERDGSGHVTLRPEDDEDMWHVYNLISEVRTLFLNFASQTSLHNYPYVIEGR